MTSPAATHAAVVSVSSISMLNDDLPRRMRELVEAGSRHILLDLAGLADIDSNGMGELVVGQISVNKAGGSLTLLHVSPGVKEQMRLAGLYSVLTIRDDEARQAEIPRRNHSEVYLG